VVVTATLSAGVLAASTSATRAVGAGCSPTSTILASPRAQSLEVQAKAINDRGDVVGFADSDNSKGPIHAILWKGGKAAGAGAARSSAKKSAAARKPPSTANAALRDIADTLYRVAAESGSRHHRYAELVERGVSDGEQKSARSAVRECDEILGEAVDLYELACLGESNHGDDAWWHKANVVWRASKEYLRHHASSNRLTRGGEGSDKSRAAFMDLSIEYELEASTLLSLRHAVDAYRAARPEAF